MGCAAGKHVTSSPEVSSSTNVTTAVSKENGWPFVVSAGTTMKINTVNIVYIVIYKSYLIYWIGVDFSLKSYSRNKTCRYAQ